MEILMTCLLSSSVAGTRLIPFLGSAMGKKASGFSVGKGGFTNVSFGFSRPTQEPTGGSKIPQSPMTFGSPLKRSTKAVPRRWKSLTSDKWLNPDRKSIGNEDKILTIEVKRGWKKGSKITFPKEGNQTSNNIPADIVLVLKDNPHNIFRKAGSDVIYSVRISLQKALCGCSFSVPTLDGRTIPAV